MKEFLRAVGHYLMTPEKITRELVRPFRSFFRKEASSSIVLMVVTSVAFLWANSPYWETYELFWETHVSLSAGAFAITKTVREWIDEGLMAVFFLIVGLEIKREVMVGELASVRQALLPVGAAIGGMLFPALIFAAFNRGEVTAGGWGIPMATDIAFALGALFVFGRRIPLGLRVFLSALAIADDLGAVLVIALFYTKELSVPHLLLSLVAVFLMAVANYLWIRKTLVYALLGIALWFFMLESGLHATVAGVVVAMFIPARGKYDTDKFMQEVSTSLGQFQCPVDGCGYSILLNQQHLNVVQSIELACHEVETPLQRLVHALHPWVAFLIVPLFAFANAGLTVTAIDVVEAVTFPLTIGVACGLFLGKPLGILLFSAIFVRARLASLPVGVTWPHIAGAGLLGGLGFTMSLFIAGLSFEDPAFLDYAKLGILAGSLMSGMAGMAVLHVVARRLRPGGSG